MISIIIPAYNAEATIKKCLNSFSKQKTREKFEVIVVDDGSTDKTKEIVKSFGVRLIEQKHRGPAAARNLGAEKAKGSIILFTDSDCVPESNWVEEMTKPFKKKGIAGVQGIYKTKQKSLVARFSQIEIEERYERIMKLGVDGIGTYSAGYRKKIFMKMKGFDKRFPIASGEDFDLSYRIKKKYALTFNPNAVVYHQHPESLKKYLKQKYYRAFWRVRLYKKHPKKMKSDSYTPQLLKVQIGLFYLLVASSLATLANSIFTLPSLGILAFLIISTFPFLGFSIKRDFAVGITSPGFIILRSIAFGLGLISGLIKGK